MAWKGDDDPVLVITLKRASTEVYIEPGLTEFQREQLEESVPARLEQLKRTWQDEVVER